MKSRIYAIYGAGGYGREVMPVARQQLLSMQIPHELIFLVDDKESDFVNGQRVMNFEDFLAQDAAEKYASIAIASGQDRERLSRRLHEHGINPWSLRASNTVVMDQVTIGEGAILSPFVTITSNVTIGAHFHANIYSYVAHDCVIGDFVTFAPSVHCNGNIVIEDHVYIGTGALLRPGSRNKPLVIGQGAVIGMGAVVTKDVPAGQTVVGNPARILSKS